MSLRGDAFLVLWQAEERDHWIYAWELPNSLVDDKPRKGKSFHKC
jgi:hypothetical protein